MFVALGIPSAHVQNEVHSGKIRKRFHACDWVRGLPQVNTLERNFPDYGNSPAQITRFPIEFFLLRSPGRTFYGTSVPAKPIEARSIIKTSIRCGFAVAVRRASFDRHVFREFKDSCAADHYTWAARSIYLYICSLAGSRLNMTNHQSAPDLSEHGGQVAVRGSVDFYCSPRAHS